MSKNEDSAFVMASILAAKIGQEVTVYLEGGKILKDYTVDACDRGEIVLRSREGEDLVTVFHTTPNRIIAIQDVEVNPSKKSEDECGEIFEGTEDPLGDEIIIE